MRTIFSFVIISILLSCNKKEALLEEPASYASAYFINNSVLSVGVKYQGLPVDWLGNEVKVLSGPATFSFYNRNTGETILEKELDIQATDNEPWYLFQPDSTIAPQLIRNTQLSEPAAPEGYIKLKLANFASQALTDAAGVPFPIVDVIVHSTVISSFAYVPIDTLIGIGRNLDTASYRLVKRPVRAGALQINFRYSFIDHTTKQPVLAVNGSLYVNGAATLSITPKNTFTYYFTNVERTANTGVITRNNKYYNIGNVLLFN